MLGCGRSAAASTVLRSSRRQRAPCSGAGLAAGCAAGATPMRSLFGQAFDVGAITATRRETSGSGASQAARRQSLIPGIIYGYDGAGGDKTELVHIAEGDLRREVNKRKACFYNTLYDVTIDGERVRALPRDFQVHPFRPKAISINWLRYRAGAYPGVKLDIPLKSFNEERCPGIKEGGWLLELVHKLPVYASGDSIPDFLMLDLRGLKVGDKIMASQVELNDGLLLRSRVRDFAIARIMGSRRAPSGEAEVAPAAATPAAGDKGKAPAKA